MLKQVALAATFVAALAVAGLGMSSAAEAGCGYRGGHYGGYGGFGPSYRVSYGPRYSTYYGASFVPRFHAHGYGTPYHHGYRRGIRFSLGF